MKKCFGGGTENVRVQHTTNYGSDVGVPGDLTGFSTKIHVFDSTDENLFEGCISGHVLPKDT